MGRIRIFAVIAVLIALAWSGINLLQHDDEVDPVAIPDGRQGLDESGSTMPADSPSMVTAEDNSLTELQPAGAQESTDAAPGSGPGDPVWIDENAVGPGGLPSDNVMPIPPEFNDPGTPGLAPEAYEPEIPMAAPEHGEPQPDEGIPPEIE